MSQCYHISLSESVSRQIKSDDRVSYPIQLTEILPVDEMRQLLKQNARRTRIFPRATMAGCLPSERLAS